jgi:hypothetical protein
MNSRLFLQSRHPTWRRLAALLTLGLLFAVICVFVYYLLEQFRVKTINCTEAGAPCDPNVLSFFEGYKGKRIFQPFIFDVPQKSGTITLQYPSTLIVRIDTPKTLVHIEVNEHQSVSVFSDETYRIDSATPDSVRDSVHIQDASLTAQSNAGKISSQKYHSYESILSKQRELEIEKVIFHSDSEIELQTKRQLTAILSVENIDAQLRSLQVILYSPTIEQKPARVDLRFERPVLRYL